MVCLPVRPPRFLVAGVVALAALVWQGRVHAQPAPHSPAPHSPAAAGSPAAKPPQPAVPAPASASPEILKARFALTADKGFFDDPMAIEPGARRVAVLRTDSASFAEMQVIDLEVGKVVLTFPVGDAGQSFEQIHFAADGAGFVLVSKAPGSEQRTAQYFDPAGKARGSVGPASRFAGGLLGDARVLVGLDEKLDPKGGGVYTVTAYRLDAPQKIGKPRTHKIGKDGFLASPQVRVISFQSGFLRASGVLAGGFDKKKDMRVPDRAATIDMLQATVVAETPIEDVVGFTLLAKMRKDRENRSAFVLPSDDNAGLDLIDATGVRSRLPLSVPFELYEITTLREQEGPEGGMLYFSLNVDPVNPPALRRQKADKPHLDIYATYLANKNETAIKARIPGIDERPTAWVAGYGRVVVLRKHKGFSRGGRDLEIYDLH